MDAKIGGFFESVGNFFTGGDHIPWCDSDIVTVSTLFIIFLFIFLQFDFGNCSSFDIEEELLRVWDQAFVGFSVNFAFSFFIYLKSCVFGLYLYFEVKMEKELNPEDFVENYGITLFRYMLKDYHSWWTLGFGDKNG